MFDDTDGTRIALIFGGLLGLAVLAVGALFWFAPGIFGGDETVPADRPAKTAAKSAAPGLPGDAKPTFDIVRVESSGKAVVAGRAEPGATVTLFANGKAVGSMVADERGEWTLILDKPLSEGSQELTLTSRRPGGQEIASDERVIVVVVPREGAPPLVVKRQEGKPSEILSGGGGRPEGLAVSAIDYDGRGNVIISGLASPHAPIRAYVDGTAFGATETAASGRWVVEADERLKAGVYNLRIDQLSADGRLVARVEFPFEREDPKSIVIGDGKVVVQPGNSLWRIASQAYGRGIEYTIIFQANRTQIADPDLIYPGQVFELPPDARRTDRPMPVSAPGSGSGF